MPAPRLGVAGDAWALVSLCATGADIVERETELGPCDGVQHLAQGPALRKSSRSVVVVISEPPLPHPIQAGARLVPMQGPVRPAALPAGRLSVESREVTGPQSAGQPGRAGLAPSPRESRRLEEFGGVWWRHWVPGLQQGSWNE